MNVLFPENADPADIVQINGYPAPPTTPMQIGKAAKAILKLMTNVEETKYVYDLFQAVSSKAYRRGFEKFSASEAGRRVLNGEVKIEEILSRRDWLSKLPEGTVGRCYYEMVKTKEFSVDGLLVAAKHAGIDVSKPTMFEAYRRYFIHFEVSHDLWHVLTGYDTDPMGEVCLLEFYRAQWPDIGLRALNIMSWVSGLIYIPTKIGQFTKALREGYRAGALAEDILTTDLEWMLEQPLRDVRQALNIQEPRIYRSIPYEIRCKLNDGGATVTGQTEPVFEVGWA